MIADHAKPGQLARLWRSFIAASEAAVAAGYRAPWAGREQRNGKPC
ncbi:MAG: hypothetical protein ABIQ81_04165 [Novosphingobium sp.]